jgi:hypothetical protein
LPKLLIELLEIQNGGYTKEYIFPMTEKTSWSNDHVPLYQLFGIVTDNSVKTAHNIMDTEYMTKEWDLPKKQVILSGEGNWWITLDYRTSDNPSVLWIDTDIKEEVKVATSFEDFINGLVAKEE